MKNKITITIAALLVVAVLLIAACAPKTAEQPAAAPSVPEAIEQPSPPVAAGEVPEIAQAEQTVQEIGTSDVEEIDKDLDEIVLP